MNIKDVTILGQRHLCAIINTYGTGQHPFAEEGTLEYFEKDYIRECLDTAYEKNNHVERREIVNSIRKELDI